MPDGTGPTTLEPKHPRKVDVPPSPDESEERHFKFPTAFTVLAAVLLLVWVA